MEFNVGDKVIVRSMVNATEPQDHGIIKMIKPSIDPNSRRPVTLYGVLMDGREAPESWSELVMLLVWLPKEDLISE